MCLQVIKLDVHVVSQIWSQNNDAIVSGMWCNTYVTYTMNTQTHNIATLHV